MSWFDILGYDVKIYYIVVYWFKKLLKKENDEGRVGFEKDLRDCYLLWEF